MFKDKYEIFEILGKGGLGEVAKARKINNPKEVYAIKQIFVSDTIKKEDIEKEIHILYLMNSYYSIKLYETFFENNIYYLVMELCDGNLKQEIIKENGFSIHKIKKIMKQLNEIFLKLRNHNFFYIDLKPENILIKKKTESDFDIKLEDYGTMRKIKNFSKDGTFCSNFDFMAPEIIDLNCQDEHKFYNKADLWSIGVILYFMKFNQYPFTGENNNILMKNIKIGKLPSKLPDDEKLRNLIESLLKTDPEERISWENYFCHPFFNDDIELLNDNYSNLNINDSETISSFNPFRIFNIKDFIDHYADFCTRTDHFFEINRNIITSNKINFLSYFALYNKDNFYRNGETFSIKKKDIFYYIIMNNLENIKKIIEENKYILAIKDNFKRTLLHISVMGNYYEISEFLLKKGINYNEPDAVNRTALSYAKGKIKDLLESYGANDIRYNISSDVVPRGIVIHSKESNIIDIIYHQFLDKGIADKMELVKNNGNIIGKRIFRNYENCKNNINQDILVYHGTKFTSIEGIMTSGLYFFNRPIEGHIPLGIKYNNIKNWAKAIFVSPSLFYASKYSEIIFSDNQEWFIIIEGTVKQNNFTEHESTIYNYKLRINEPNKIEYRVNCEKDPVISNGDWDNNVSVLSLLFVKKQILDNMKAYSEQLIFKL